MYCLQQLLQWSPANIDSNNGLDVHNLSNHAWSLHHYTFIQGVVQSSVVSNVIPYCPYSLKCLPYATLWNPRIMMLCCNPFNINNSLLLHVATALLAASTSSYSSVVQSARLLTYYCRQLTCGLFQLMHISPDDHAVQLIKFEPNSWWPKWRQNITTALTTLPQGWVSARKHQCTTYNVDRIFVGLSW